MDTINLNARLFLNNVIYNELEVSLLQSISTAIDCLSIHKNNNIIQLKVKKTSVKNIPSQNLLGYYKSQIITAMNTFFSINYKYIVTRLSANYNTYPNIDVNNLYSTLDSYYNIVIISDSIIQIIL